MMDPTSSALYLDYNTSDSEVRQLVTSSINPFTAEWYRIPLCGGPMCRDVHSLNRSEKCDFVQTAPDCLQNNGFFAYTIFCFCTLGDHLLPLGVTILILFWLVLFVALAVCADDFFCPSLQVIARTLRMSDNIAGVTLLAFGNGAPDVFSAIAAVQGAKGGDVGLALGALLGAGVFVTTVVAGAITMVTSFHVMERPFLRDVVFYIAAVFMTFYVLYDHRITLVEAIAFIGLYVVYVIVVVVGRIIYQKQKQMEEARQQLSIQSENDEHDEVIPRSDVDTESANSQSAMLGWGSYGGTNNPQMNGNSGYFVSGHAMSEIATYEWAANDSDLESNSGSSTDSEDAALLQDVLPEEQSQARRTPLISFIGAVSPVDTEEWRESRWFLKPYLVYKTLPLLILRLTVPVVDETADNCNWNRYLNTLHCVVAPPIGLFLASYHYALYKIGDVFPVWALLLLVGCVLAAVVFLTSKDHQPPVYHWVFAYVGFFVAVIWIQAIATEIVNLLETFGVIFNISNAILGLTLLAWGNSIGDMVADVVMAKQGSPRAGISACFGGPLFNLLMGIGIPFTMGCASTGDYEIQLSLISVVLVGSLLFSLVCSLLALPLMRFNLTWRYGIYLFVLYGVFLVVALLVESGVIKGSV